MKETRKTPTKSISATVLKEYSHLCAICASRDPHLHHIDENPSNSVAENLLPLCPNCHLRDQHNPTKAIEIGRLQLFRRYKDPSILSSKFQPLYKRLDFILSIESGADSTDKLFEQCQELCRFIESLPQGNFYSAEILALTKRPTLMFFGGDGNSRSDATQERNEKYREQLSNSSDRVVELIMELLRYQNWPYERV